MEKMIGLMNDLRQNNEYFSQYFPEGEITDENVEEIYWKAPVINKEEIQRNLRKYISNDFFSNMNNKELQELFEDVSTLSQFYDRTFEVNGKEWTIETTSGSTGKPFAILKSSTEKIMESKRLLRCRKRISPGLNFENGFMLYKPTDDKLKSVFEKLMFDEELKKAVDYLAEGDYKWILCSAQQMRRIYSCAKDNHMEEALRKVPIQMIETTSQALFQEEKEDMAELFPNALFISQYGCREVWNVAYECPCGKLHINNENLIVDVVDEEGNILGDNQIGNVIITSLIHKSMPFFKYYLGDRSKIIREICACGSSVPRIELVIGRDKQRIVGTNLFGNEIFRKVMRNIYFEHSDIKLEKFKIIQVEEKVFEVYLVIEDKYRKDFEQYFYDSCNYQIPNFENYTVRFIFNYPFIDNLAALKQEIFENRML